MSEWQPKAEDARGGIVTCAGDGLPEADHSRRGCRAAARTVGIYRLWRDFGSAVRALAAGVVTDLISAGAAIGAVAVLTTVSGVIVASTRWGDQTMKPDAGQPTTVTLLTRAAFDEAG